MLCKKCGTVLPDTAKFCAKCGNPLPQQDIEAAQKKVVPEVAQKWNWGAALLTWIWALGNKTYGWAIAGFILNATGIGWVLNFFLFGLNGSEWAWKNKEWESVEQFQKVQRSWGKWGVIILVAFTSIGIMAVMFEEESPSTVPVQTEPVSESQKNDPVAAADYSEGYKAGYVDGRASKGNLGDNYAEPATEARKGDYASGYLDGFLTGCREGGFDCSEVENAINRESNPNSVQLIPSKVN